jgi:acyl dehydratase
MTGPRSRRYDDVAIGDALPAMDFNVTLTSLVMYAGATWDFHRYHYDAAFVAKLGMPAPFMDGQMVGALMTRQLMQWGGGDAFVRKLSYRQRGTVYAGDSIVFRGAVSGKTNESGRALVTCRLSVNTADGTEIVRDASATVELGCRT